jgi:hypothetical protein
VGATCWCPAVVDYNGDGKTSPYSPANKPADPKLDRQLPHTKKFAILRVPYPLGFYSRYAKCRIDDPKAGWKGRGLWSADGTRVNWHNEGGKGSTSYVVHFQLRPDPLAK